MQIHRFASTVLSAVKNLTRSSTSQPAVTVLPPGQPRARSISFVYRRESYNPLERRLDRAHSHFELDEREQQMGKTRNFPDKLGHGPGNLEDRDNIEPQEVDYNPSRHAQTGPIKGKVWTREYEARDIWQPDPAAGHGHKVPMGQLTEEGASKLDAFLNKYNSSDTKGFDATGVLKYNCAVAALKIGEELGLDIEK